MPIGHIGLNVPDLALAREYYDALMPVVGFEALGAGPDWFAYRPADDTGTRLFLNTAPETAVYSRFRPGLQHIAFSVSNRAQVHVVHEWALARGSEILNEPGLWPQYHPDYYAVFWADPHGFKLEAFCIVPSDDAGGW
jgi:catechol 2,3-dioxygenase-like lactoylglutathione lyase family enzyme